MMRAFNFWEVIMPKDMSDSFLNILSNNFLQDFPACLLWLLICLKRCLSLTQPNGLLVKHQNFWPQPLHDMFSFLVLHFYLMCVRLSFSMCSWWGYLSPIFVISSWPQRWASLSQAFQFWFWGALNHWRKDQGTDLEGVREVLSGLCWTKYMMNCPGFCIICWTYFSSFNTF